MEILNVQSIYPIIKGRSYKLRHRNQISEIMVHHSGSGNLSVAELYKLHTSDLHKWATIGYHFYVSKNAIIYQVNDILTVVNGCQDRNTNVIHVCFEGNYHQDIIRDYHEKAFRFILQHLLNMKIVPKITYHSKHKNTICPGKNMIILIEKITKNLNTQSKMIWDDI